MLKNINKLLLILNLFLLISNNAFAETFTLDQALDRAIKANYDIQNASERITRLQSFVGEIRASALPHLSGELAYQRNFKRPELNINGNIVTIGNKNTYTGTLLFSQPLFKGGKVSKALDAAKEERESTQESFEDYKDEISFQVKNLFYQILFVNKSIEITKKTLNQLTRHLSTIKTRYNEGLESDYTLMRQEVELSNIKPELSKAEESRTLLVNAMKVLLALPSDEELELDGELAFRPIEKLPVKSELISKALSSRNDLLSAKAHVNALKHNVGIERGGYFPDLDLTSALTWQGQTDDFRPTSIERFYSLNARLVLSVPIFDGLKTHYRIREAKSDLKIASTEELKLKAFIEAEIENAVSEYKSATQREETQGRALKLAEKAVSIASLRFGQGLTSQLELNDTITSRDQAEKLYAEAVYDCLRARANLVRVVGGEI